MKNLLSRTITGIIFLAILIAGMLNGPIPFAIVFFIVEILLLIEFYLIAKKQSKPQILLGSITGGYIFISSFLWYYLKTGGIYLSLLIVPFLIFIFVIELYRKTKQPLLNIAVTLLGLIYVSVPLALLNHIAYLFEDYQGKIILGIFILMWIYDTGAYVFGMLLGKNRLFPRISPKKSWEGFFGGMLSTIVAAYFLSKYLNIFDLTWYAIAVIIVVFGTFGDLTESMFKRSLNIKDSGKILPGHGGILDRFDGILLAIPIIFTFLYFFVKQVKLFS